MTPRQSDRDTAWASDEKADVLRRRIESFWNLDYLTRVVLPLLGAKSGDRILDVGCGYGGLALLLARHLPETHVTGLDFEPRGLRGTREAATQLELANVDGCLGDARRIPCADGSYDIVTCQTLLQHVPDAAEVVAEMARVLRSGGTLMAVEGYATGLPARRDNVFPHRDARWLEEMFRLLRLYFAGKQALGRGDSTVGGHLPFLIMDAGLRIRDVRLNDRPLCALPPYATTAQQRAIEMQRTWLAEPLPESFRSDIEAFIVAGGGTPADVERYLALAHDESERRVMLQAIEEGTYGFVGSFNIHIVIGDKP
jgi:ubiquinone/menaquinone biosynthesis C-methylase UbiE